MMNYQISDSSFEELQSRKPVSTENLMGCVGNVAILLSLYLLYNNSCDPTVVLWFQCSMGVYAYLTVVIALMLFKIPLPVALLTPMAAVGTLGAMALGTAAEFRSNVR